MLQAKTITKKELYEISKNIVEEVIFSEEDAEEAEMFITTYLGANPISIDSYIVIGKDNAVHLFNIDIVDESNIKYMKKEISDEIVFYHIEEQYFVVATKSNDILNLKFYNFNLVELTNIDLVDSNYEPIDQSAIVFMTFVNNIPFVLTTDELITIEKGENVYNKNINAKKYISHFVFDDKIVVLYRARFGLVRSHVTFVNQIGVLSTVEHTLTRKYSVILKKFISKYAMDKDSVYIISGNSLCILTYKLKDNDRVVTESSIVDMRKTIGYDIAKFGETVYLLTVHHSDIYPSVFGTLYLTKLNGRNMVNIGKTMVKYNGLNIIKLRIALVNDKFANIVFNEKPVNIKLSKNVIM